MGFQLTLQFRQAAVLDFARLAQLAAPLRAFEFGAGGVDLALDDLRLVDLGFLRLELRRQPGALFLQVGEFLFQLGEPVLAGGVLFLRQRLTLHLALHDLAVQLVDLRRLGIQLDLQTGSRLVHEVHRLVRQETLGQIPVRKLRRRDERRVENADAVVDLVALLQAAQDGDGVLHARLVHDHRLETAFQGGVLFDVLAVLVERGRADGAQFAARELGLEQVGRVHGTLRRARADDGVEFVDEQDDLPLARRDLLEKRLEPVLELAAELRPGDHRPEVHGDDPLALERFGHVARDDPAREPLDDGRLADAGIADEHGVVLRAAAEHLHEAADLVVAADDGVDLALAGLFGEVLAVFLQGLVLALGVLVGDALVAAHLLERLHEPVARDLIILEQPGGRVVRAGQREEIMLGAQELVLERGHLAVGVVERLAQALGKRELAAAADDLRAAGEFGVETLAELRGGDADLFEQGAGDAVGLVEKGAQEVFVGQFGMAAVGGVVLGGLESLLG